ncbi:MAG: triose-phosphate isomerase [Candidatus Nanohalobium sp.]
MLIVNYKAYSKAIGEKSEELTRKIEEGAEDAEVVICPQTADLNRIDTELKIFAQHVDGVDTGSHTGSNQAKAVKEVGATGTLINHSERRLEEGEIRESVEKCREEDLTTVVCAQSPEECERYAEFEPDYIAFEPPELIGGDTSVSTAEPEIVEEAVKKSGKIDTLTGAGIKSREDVEKSIELGCEGVLIASGVIKSEDTKSKVEELCRGL